MKKDEISVGMLVSLSDANFEYANQGYKPPFSSGIVASEVRPKNGGKSRVYEVDVNWGTQDKPVIRTHPTTRLIKVQSKGKAA